MKALFPRPPAFGRQVRHLRLPLNPTRRDRPSSQVSGNLSGVARTWPLWFRPPLSLPSRGVRGVLGKPRRVAAFHLAGGVPAATRSHRTLTRDRRGPAAANGMSLAVTCRLGERTPGVAAHGPRIHCPTARCLSVWSPGGSGRCVRPQGCAGGSVGPRRPKPQRQCQISRAFGANAVPSATPLAQPLGARQA